jgi:hypothetical protein
VCSWLDIDARTASLNPTAVAIVVAFAPDRLDSPGTGGRY